MKFENYIMEHSFQFFYMMRVKLSFIVSFISNKTSGENLLLKKK